MKEIVNYTKLEPNERIEITNDIINMLYDTNIQNSDKLSPKERSEYYGIEVKPLNKLFSGYYIINSFIHENNKESNPNNKSFPILQKMDMIKWLCFYEETNYKEAQDLYNHLFRASKRYELKINEPEWVEMPNRGNANDWIDKADFYFANGKNEYDFVIFLIGRNTSIYKVLKQHSLYKNKYVSQAVKISSIKRKGLLSICSKILLQINEKLGGISFKAHFDRFITERKIMAIGVDTSHIKGNRTGLAMVATINDTFSDFFNKEDIIEEKNKRQLAFPISSFLDEAIEVYQKENNNERVRGVIIYRQGVSFEQKDYLKSEILQIDNICKIKCVNYYYILVNKKVNFKFFEKSNKGFSNPESGLLVMDGITNKNYFEFYIQPQEITQGSAIPICYHVAYGNFDFPEIIPKLAYDLCNIYCNYQGKIRIPNVLKMAEKLSKMAVKYKPDNNSEYRLGKTYV